MTAIVGAAKVGTQLGRTLLIVAFFASGAAALLFQVLWFRQLSTSLGNTVWASSLVLASFMGGLALGNLIAARSRSTPARALRAYAALELVIGATGLGLVLLLPSLPELLAPWWRSLSVPLVVNAARLGIASVLLMLPTTAMGATLPVLMAGLAHRRGVFGAVLGRLYGWNTLGAMCGAWLADSTLVGGLGLAGTGWFAAGLNVFAAALSYALSSRWPLEPAEEPEALDITRGLRGRPAALVFAAALIGACGLALEVVWFRFLTLYVAGTTVAFAVMLAVVLGGIALGGMAGGAWAGRSADASRWGAPIAAAAGIATVVSYASFHDVKQRLGLVYVAAPTQVVPLAAALMGATCLLSGCLFPLIGRALREVSATPARAAGVLTLANTAGATLGALAGGFLLLPVLGIERSLFLLATAYAVAAVLLGAGAGLPAGRPALVVGAPGVLLALVLALFPFGLMERVHVRDLASRYGKGMRLEEWREGLTETSLLLREDLLGQPSRHRLVTNGHPMSATGFDARRYMRLYVYWAQAVHPEIRRVALISYGVGNTAAALVEAPDIRSIDVVDISRDILSLGRLIFAGQAFPLDDARVKVHVEDGRFFLLRSTGGYDLITSEPPPPRLAGVVNLYTREYFELIRGRLAEGGLVTYWLPVHDLDRRSAASVVRGFCDAFPDCSLWTGAGFDWMLAGSRGGRSRVDEEAFARQWRTEPARSSLRAIGLDSPERLGALFQADAAALATFVGDAPALTDDFPHRIQPFGPGPQDPAFYREWMRPAACRTRFESSALIRDWWPQGLAARSAAYFEEQALYTDALVPAGPRRPGVDFARVHHVLRDTDTQALPLLLMGSDPRQTAIAEQAAAAGRDEAPIAYLRALGALARRDYVRAADHFAQVAAREPDFGDLVYFRALAGCLSGDAGAAVLVSAARARAADEDARAFWNTLRCP